MDYKYAIEKRDISKIDKLNAIHDLVNFWTLVRKLTKNVKSAHALNRWQCLSEIRYNELKQIWLNWYFELRQYLINEIGPSTMDLVDSWILDKGNLPTYDMSGDSIECAHSLKSKYKVLKSLKLLK